MGVLRVPRIMITGQIWFRGLGFRVPGLGFGVGNLGLVFWNEEGQAGGGARSPRLGRNFHKGGKFM